MNASAVEHRENHFPKIQLLSHSKSCPLLENFYSGNCADLTNRTFSSSLLHHITSRQNKSSAKSYRSREQSKARHVALVPFYSRLRLCVFPLMYHILGLPEQKMPFTFYCDLIAGLPHFPHRCQTFASMPRNMIRWWQRRNRPWQHMAPFQENRFRHNIHVEAMKFIRPREDLKHLRTIRAQIIHSRICYDWPG